MNYLKQEIEKFLSEAEQSYMPRMSVDSVLFCYEHAELQVLTFKLFEGDEWVLPGGFTKKTMVNFSRAN